MSLEKKFRHALTESVKADLRYQRDCNMRLGVSASEPKRARLKRQSQSAHDRLQHLSELLLTRQNGPQSSGKGTRSDWKE